VFDVGFTELLLIGVVSLVVIGPERLPDVARSAGKWIGKMQRFVRGVKTDIANELDSGELKRLIGDQREQIEELRKTIGSTTRELESSTKNVVRGARKKLTELEDAASRADGESEADADVSRPDAPSTPPLPPAPASSPAEPPDGDAAAARTIDHRPAADTAPVDGASAGSDKSSAGSPTELPAESSAGASDTPSGGARDTTASVTDTARQSGSGT